MLENSGHAYIRTMKGCDAYVGVILMPLFKRKKQLVLAESERKDFPYGYLLC